MKKRDLILLIILIIEIIAIIYLFLASPKFTGMSVNYIESEKFICSDSDNGQNYSIKGFVKQGDVVKGTDYCTNATRLKEYYCLTKTSTLYYYYDCPYKCSNGACVEKEQEGNKEIVNETVKTFKEESQESAENEVAKEQELSSLKMMFDKIKKLFGLN
jgi:hypothetical protein